MYYGLKHHEHDGTFVRKFGSWKKYHEWCVENGFAKIKNDEVVFITKPIKSNKIGRNEKCPCGSNKKYKKCCM